MLTASQTHLVLAAQPVEAPRAREYVRSAARECGLASLADTAELVASEMITNALRAAEGLVPVVRIWVTTDDDSLTIRVWDSSDDVPVLQEAGPDAERGRGLMIIDALSADWGCDREKVGKVVWALITS